LVVTKELALPSLLIRHKVEDYATWKAVFDEHGATRRANGSRGGRLFRNATDPTEVLVLLEWDDLTRARLFADSDDLREAMARAGVADRPDVWFLEDADPPTV
jgi:heme-degrading monooxygenase HmoA